MRGKIASLARLHDRDGLAVAVKPNTIRMDFEDNGILALVTGEHNQNLAQIEAALDGTLDSFGNCITVSGAAAMTKKAQRALEAVSYTHLTLPTKRIV